MTTHSLPLAIAADHPAYAGHFPGLPILPGVVLLDEALLALAALQGMPVAASQIKSAKFLSPVQPGESLRLEYSSTAAGVFRFELKAAERVVASGIVAFSAADGATS
jgi:3-hydroxymyristoyl/3-hydroxydecanoyl-(acyl carrier protein) dehydratase